MLPPSTAEAVAAVRQAVERLDGAGWIDVAAQYFPPQVPGWGIVYPRGRCNTPETPVWCERRRQVEATATAALIKRRIIAVMVSC